MKQEILKQLEKLWEIYPNQRFGQLLINFVFEESPFFQEDNTTLNNIWRKLRWMKIKEEKK